VQNDNTIRRTVSRRSRCANEKHGSSQDALGDIATADASAQALASATSDILNVSSVSLEMLGEKSKASEAYYKWFGGPKAGKRGTFKSRFRSKSFKSENQAAAHEMKSIATRLQQVSDWLTKPVRYICMGKRSYTIKGCKATRCTADAVAISCPTGARTILLCKDFWTPKEMASTIIHEAAHARLRWGSHGNSWRGKKSNPACYGAFVRELFGPEVDSAQCKPVTKKNSESE
jgi:hypothetical protein